MSAVDRLGAPSVVDNPGRWNDLVIICATTPWDGHQLLDQRLAAGLNRHAPVLYVDPPVSPLTSFRHPELAATLAAPALRPIGPRMMRLTPRVLPGKERPVLKALALAATRRAMRQAVATLGSPSVAAVIVPSLNPLLGVCGERTSVFYAKDDYVAGARLMNIGERRLRRAAERQLAAADVIVAASPMLADKWRRLGYDPLLIPNGCDPTLGARVDRAPRPASLSLAHPVAGFVGQLSERTDLSLLRAVVEAGHSLLLVGPCSPSFPLSELTAIPGSRVAWVGPRTSAELPGYLRLIDVGLVPYAADSPFNQASFPLKMLEYLSAGIPVVATSLPAVRWLATDLISVADTPAAFAAAVSDAAARHDRAAVEERRAFAAQHSWDARTDQLAAALGLTDPIHTDAVAGARSARGVRR